MARAACRPARWRPLTASSSRSGPALLDPRGGFRQPTHVDDTRERVLDAGEAMMKRAGYCGFSFADVAREVDIRKASVHHHFPTKADLAVASVVRYRETALAHLGTPKGAEHAIKALGALFLGALDSRGEACLCGSLAADWQALPEPVQGEVRDYWSGLTEWLRQALMRSGEPNKRAQKKARLLLAWFEGAIMSARVVDDRSIVRDTIRAATAFVQADS